MENEFIEQFTDNMDNHINFSTHVEELSMKDGISLTETIILLMEEYDIDFGDISKLISPQLKERIYQEENMGDDNSKPLF